MSDWLSILYGAALAGLVSFLITGLLIPLAHRWRLLDHPNERSSHSQVTPRIGGLGLLTGMLVSVTCFSHWDTHLLIAIAGGAILLILGLLDDRFDLPSGLRFPVQIAVVAVMIWLLPLAPRQWGLPYECWTLPAWMAKGFSVIFILAFLNFFNFMDGINGIAGSQSFLGAAGLAALMGLGGYQGNVFVIAIALAGAAFGFLPWNYPRARTFMGDCGSTVQGVILAAMSCFVATTTEVPFVACVLPMFPFFYDATFTVLKRALRGEKVWKAHREHHYQLLVRMNWSHTIVTAVYIVQYLLCIGIAIGYAYCGDLGRIFLLVLLGGVYGLFSFWIHRLFKRFVEGECPISETQNGSPLESA